MKTAVISGTSKGIGWALAQVFLSKGYQVIGISRSGCPKKNEHLIDVVADLSNPRELNVVKKALQPIGKIHILINNAGTLLKKPFHKTSWEDWNNCYSTNVFGVAILTQALLPHFEKGSHIVNISSMGGIQGSNKFPGLATYSSSKGALITLSEILAEEFKPLDIAVNCLALGAVETAMLKEAFPEAKTDITPKLMADYIFQFATTAHQYMNGKIIPLSRSTP